VHKVVLVISSQDLSQLSPKNPSIHPALHFLEFVSQFGIPPLQLVVPAVRLTVQPLLGVFQIPEIADLDVHLGGVAVDVIHSIALLEIVAFMLLSN
jgi:hypothetical protein